MITEEIKMASIAMDDEPTPSTEGDSESNDKPAESTDLLEGDDGDSNSEEKDTNTTDSPAALLDDENTEDAPKEEGSDDSPEKE